MIDPNVWISALINPYGTPARVVELVMTGSIIALVTPHLVDELSEVLARPKLRRWVKPDDARDFIDALPATGVMCPEPGPPTHRIRDRADDYLVALAETTGAILVSADADLLNANLEPPALTPRALIERLDA